MDTTALAERLEAESVRRECVPTRTPTFNPESRFVHGESLRAVLKEAASALRAGAEPVAWMFQHDETGRMTICPNDGVNTPKVFAELNPRYALIEPLYTRPQPATPAIGEVWEARYRYALTLFDAAEDDGDGMAGVAFTCQVPMHLIDQEPSAIAALLCENAHPLPTQPATPASGEAVAVFDAAVAAELPRVSHVQYDSHEICKHFAGELRKRLTTPPASKGGE